MRFLSKVFAGTAVFCLMAASAPVVSYGSNAHDLASARYNMRILYNSAITKYYKKKYKEAIALFDKIEALYPFSSVAVESSLMSAVAHYELGDYDAAYNLADGYIAVYPNSKIVTYAYYLRMASKYMSILDLGLDHTSVLEAKELATEFVRMFPESRYVGAVSYMLQEIKMHMAAKEFLIAKFYMRRGVHTAAIGRFNLLVEQYPDSKYFAESLYRLVESYMALGDNAAANAALLKLAALGESGKSWYEKGMRCIAKGTKKTKT
ncbi:outer membrane protein assembly factor BamD [Anaplasma bovis]|uniref:outer membrane protein assembly factor BamD n=1 Tax=Anaplasma bovis TaxID=186733 RepID=UPI002FF07786